MVVIAAIVIAVGLGASKPAIQSHPSAIAVPAPPQATAQTANCTKVLEQLPIKVDGLAPRVVHTKPDSPFVVAWGDPAVILRCGVDRPSGLRPDSGAQFFVVGDARGPYFQRSHTADGDVFTTVDRAAYVSVTVPSHYQGSSVLSPLSSAIAKALPAVCNASASGPAADRCVNRN